MLAAVPAASAEEETREPKKDWIETLERLSVSSRDTYLKLMYENEDFLPFFSEASPIAELSLVNIGSRPAKRVQSFDAQSLRAITWVFAWTQNRFLLPSWYGAGGAPSALVLGESGGLDLLREMCRE